MELMYENSWTTKAFFFVVWLIFLMMRSLSYIFSRTQTIHNKRKMISSVYVREHFWSWSIRKFLFESAVESCVHTIRESNNCASYGMRLLIFSFFFQGKKLSIRAPMSKPQNKVGPGEAKGRGIPFFPCPSKVKKSQWLGLSGRKIGALPPAVAEHCPKHSCSKDYCRGSENVPNLPSQGWKALALISQLGDLVDQHCSTSSRDKLGLIFACLCGSKAIQQVPTYFEPKIP